MKTPFGKILAILVLTLAIGNISHAQDVLSPADLLALKYTRTNQLSPDGSQLIYSLYTPRNANEKAGGAHSEYQLLNLETGQSTALFGEDEKFKSPSWNNDGTQLAVIEKTDGKNQIWILKDNGEKIQVTNSQTGVNSFKWHPNGKAIAYIASQGKSDKQKELDKRGYNFIFYEEDIINDNLFLQEFDEDFVTTELKQLTKSVNVWNFEFDKQGMQLAYTATPLKLVDQNYMFRKIHVYDLKSEKVSRVLDNNGKLGAYSFSPDGTKLAYAAALNINDHAVSQAFYIDLKAGITKNITPDKYKGHISWVNWKSDKELIYFAGEGVNNKIFTFSLKNEKRKLILNSQNSGIIFSSPKFSSDFKQFIFTGSTPTDPSNIYSWNGKDELIKITDINPELANKQLGEQEVIRFEARDGLEVEGLLIKPVGFDANKTYPIILFVHGGPESHHSNGWLSRYATPGQVMAGKGYMAAYINYRASTGYGVDFGMEGFMDPAGKEFDDLADAIEYLIKEKGADRERVGMAGGSYGGYASAWFATYYTDYVKAVGMFVGISNIISKRGTTDIPYEELYVHSGKPLEEQWQMNLERSPVYYAHKSKTATLIYGGAADPRVHPTQSYELYRRMKMNGHPAVRLVQYPGEGHGNRKQVGQIDVLYRQLAWLDWYVRDLKPLDGPMPPLDISDQYGLDW